MESRDIDIVIASYFAGSASREELEFLKEWISETPANAECFKKRGEVWIAASKNKYDAAHAYTRFRRKADATMTGRGRAWLRVAGTIAAAAASLLLVVVLAYRQGMDTIKSAAKLAEFTVEAPAGSRTNLKLPDGTSVWLNAGSELSYSQGFGLTDRNVHLSGEAYFEVEHDESMPLVVNVKGASITDIGTKFNISAHADEDFISVSLIEGAAEVRNLFREMPEVALLKPGQQADVNRMDGHMSVRWQNAIAASEWVNGALIFDNASLASISKELARRYNVSVSIADESLKSVRFYCYFTGTHYGLDDVLRSLESTGKVKVGRENNVIGFYK